VVADLPSFYARIPLSLSLSLSHMGAFSVILKIKQFVTVIVSFSFGYTFFSSFNFCSLISSLSFEQTLHKSHKKSKSFFAPIPTIEDSVMKNISAVHSQVKKICFTWTGELVPELLLKRR